LDDKDQSRLLKHLKKIQIYLANYQERFQYVLVDEYQDTSGTQNKLVQQLIGYWDRPKYFVVGDDERSSFQGFNGGTC
jgi:DNA helicase-2/ATP-dependent DNA helicase PcrA